MNEKHAIEYEAAKSEAEVWLARLKNEQSSSSVHAEFKKWLNSSPIHKEAYEYIDSLYNDFGLLNDVILEDSSDLIDPSLISPHKKSL